MLPWGGWSAPFASRLPHVVPIPVLREEEMVPLCLLLPSCVALAEELQCGGVGGACRVGPLGALGLAPTLAGLSQHHPRLLSAAELQSGTADRVALGRAGGHAGHPSGSAASAEVFAFTCSVMPLLALSWCQQCQLAHV